MFKKEEHEAKLQELITYVTSEKVDQAKVSLLIKELRDDYSDVHSQFETLNTNLTSEQTRANDYARTNMELMRNSTGKIDLESIKKDILMKQGKEEKPPTTEEKEISVDDVIKDLM